MTQTIESRVAETILQRPTEPIEICGERYRIASPSLATLILVSEAVSFFPRIDPDPDSILTEVLRTAKDCRKIGEIAAILILGARGLTEKRTVTETRFFGLWRRKKELTVNLKEELAEKLLLHCRPSVLASVIAGRLKEMEIADFFGITTFLNEVNLLRPTGEVVETTASGPSSSAR